MSKMYFDFNVNLPDSGEIKSPVTGKEVMTPCVDTICFSDPNKDIVIRVGCNNESNFGVTAGLYKARFKGLEVSVEGEDAENHDWETMSDDDFALLKTAEPSRVVLYIDNLKFKNKLQASNLEITIEHGEEEIALQSKIFDIDADGDPQNQITVDNKAWEEVLPA